MDKKYIDCVVKSLKKFRSEIICIMSGLGHNTLKYYTYLCRIVEKIDYDIKYYKRLEDL